MAALQTGTIPAPLAWSGVAIGGVLVFSPLAALTGEHALEVAVSIAFGLDALWIFVVGMWLLLANGIAWAVFVRRGAFLLLVVAAGLVGLGLLAAPGATEKFFAWGLGPEPLAAFAGGVYVGSAALYAVGLSRPWREVRGLVAGAVVLSVSVLIVTLTHLDQFDFDRLQAWAWLVLFAGFSLVTIWLLLAGDEPDDAAASGGAASGGASGARRWSRRCSAWSRSRCGSTRRALSDESPFLLPPLGGRFAGSWIALLAVLTGWAAGATQGGGMAARARLVTLPAGALVAALTDGRRPRSGRASHRRARRPDRASACSLRERPAHPLDRLGQALVRHRQRDPEEALAVGPVGGARADDDARPAPAPPRQTRPRCGPTAPAPTRRSCPSAARCRSRSRAARRSPGRGGGCRSRPSRAPASCDALSAAAPATCTASNRPESTLVFSFQ